MKRFLSVLSITVILCNGYNVMAQAQLVERVEKKGNEVVIPFEKYVLPNGLTLIIHEDHSDPIARVDVTYHVGSAREEVGKSGFAHFFEHMMFQGSDHVADEQHFKIISEAGGTLNGTTNRDRTNYFETVPVNQLEKMLWLEADRMGFLLDAVTQEKFEVQRATVKNERGQRYDNVPYGLVREVAAKNLYPYGHPYSWLTIGYIEDLNRVTVNDLKHFFLRWYGPNNAVLTVGGDVDPKQVVGWVEKYFGPIPRGPEVKPVTLPLPVIARDRYVSMVDNYAKLPQLYITYPTPPSFSNDEAALDCLAEIIGQGKNSIFYKNMVKTKIAVNASAYNSTSELAGEFIFSITPYPGQKLFDLEKKVRESLVELEQRGITDEDIEKFTSGQEARIIRGLEQVDGKVSQLAAFQTFTGDANYIGKELKRYTSVTQSDVLRVYNQYIKNKHAVILSVLTQNDENDKAAPDNYTVSNDGYLPPSYGYDTLKYNKAKDDFDRSIMPGTDANPAVNIPEFWQSSFAGTAKAIGIYTHEIPLVTLQFKFKGGKMMDAYFPQKSGVANMFSAMMDEDTKNYSAETFSALLDKLGSSIQVYTTDDATVINVQTLRKNLAKTLHLLEERVLYPRFTQEAFDRNKDRLTENIKNAINRPNYLASILFPEVLFGAGNVLGWPSSGTLGTISHITLKDVESYYHNYFSRNQLEIVVVGDVKETDIVPELGFLAQLPDKKMALPEIKEVPKVKQTTIYFVDVPNAAQTEFRMGRVTDLKYDALGDYYKAGVMNYALGGAFNSRLNLYLREDKGWTYGARSYFDGDKYSGIYAFTAGIKVDVTDSALVDILRIINDYRTKGVTRAELDFTQKSIGQSDARKYESAFQKAGFLGRILEYDLPATYTKDQNALLEKVSNEELSDIAEQYLPSPDKMNILLVGDKEKLWDKLKKLGYNMVELDKEGNPI